MLGTNVVPPGSVLVDADIPVRKSTFVTMNHRYVDIIQGIRIKVSIPKKIVPYE